ncbi:phospholipase D-like domain-containing protein [Halorussus lipolyticus]|uniref:phospholipase D-like domain-containing protein n=1 Tax=Halorussus lipolyticus TaxID=3034024 RepID=UPI0023E878DB|nr:phospholipase D-like domain-containing protein [Halorussus sp. DT80]
MSESVSTRFRDAVDLAVIADSTRQLDVILGDVLVGSPESDGPLFPTARSRFGDDLADGVGYFLENCDLATIDSKRSSVRELDREAVIDLLVTARTVSRSFQAAAEEFDTGEYEIVCTLPDSDPQFADLSPSDFEMRRLTSALLNLCRDARESLTIVSPYLESGGVEWLLPGIEGAIRRGVNVTVVSRELEAGEPNMVALSDLFDLAGGENGELRVYDYYEANPDSRQPLYTLHSKVLVADADRAYVGSANFTTYGFAQNLEVGVIVEGSRVERLERVFDTVISSAREVTTT